MGAIGNPVSALLLYDGQCGFCNASVQWLLKHDRSGVFRFSSQQSPIGETILSRHNIDREKMLNDNSVYLVLDLDSKQERVLTRSDSAVEALLLLDGVWRIVGRLVQAVPRSARDCAYTLIARNRFKLGGRREFCPVPSAAERKKFLS